MFREKARCSVVSETFDTAHQAQFFEELVERIGGAAARAKRGRAATSTAPTMSTVLDDYIEQALDITPGTSSQYRRVLARAGFTDLTGDLPVDLIARADVEAWVEHRAGMISERTNRPIAPKAIRNEHGLLATIVGHAQAPGWVPGNVATGVRLPARGSSPIDVLSVEEFLALHAAISDHYKPLVWLLGATGMRWGGGSDSPHVVGRRHATPHRPAGMEASRGLRAGDRCDEDDHLEAARGDRSGGHRVAG